MNSKTQSEALVSPEAAVEAPVPETSPAPKTKAARKPKAEVTLANLAERYLKHLEDEGKSPGTCSSYGAELKLAMKELGPDTAIGSITTEQVATYFESKVVTKLRSGKKKAQPSIDKTRRVLRLAFVWAKEKKLIGAAPIPEPTAKT